MGNIEKKVKEYFGKKDGLGNTIYLDDKMTFIEKDEMTDREKFLLSGVYKVTKPCDKFRLERIIHSAGDYCDVQSLDELHEKFKVLYDN